MKDDEEDDEDATSSSGSLSSSISDSASESDTDSNPDSAPEEQTSKRKAPDRIPQPSRIDPSKTTHTINPAPQDSNLRAQNLYAQNLCRNMLKLGRCQFGARCRFSHDIPEELMRRRRQGQRSSSSRNTRGRAQGREAMTTTRGRRKGLYQVLVEKEMEEERRAVLGVIVQMGESGLLGDDEPGITVTSPTLAEKEP